MPFTSLCVTIRSSPVNRDLSGRRPSQALRASSPKGGAKKARITGVRLASPFKGFERPENCPVDSFQREQAGRPRKGAPPGKVPRRGGEVRPLSPTNSNLPRGLNSYLYVRICLSLKLEVRGGELRSKSYGFPKKTNPERICTATPNSQLPIDSDVIGDGSL